MQSLETKISRPKPKSFETETRPETFETETETPKNGSRDTSRHRDQVSRLHHWCLWCNLSAAEQSHARFIMPNVCYIPGL